MASCWIPQLLALEVSTTTRQAQGASRSSAADPRDELGKSSLGRSSHPWRTPQARHRCRPDFGCQVHGRRRPPSQGWRTFLLNHADGIASIDLFVVPTISFRLLYGLLILRHDRRRILWLGVTADPTAEWIARQVTEACDWESAPQYLVRDRDRAYGEAFTRRIRVMGIRDTPTAPRSPWQNGHAERLIGSIRRECVDHVIVFGEQHLRRLLRSYQQYYNGTRTHLSLAKDSPVPRCVHATGSILPLPILADCITIMSGSDLRHGQGCLRSESRKVNRLIGLTRSSEKPVRLSTNPVWLLDGRINIPDGYQKLARISWLTATTKNAVKIQG